MPKPNCECAAEFIGPGGHESWCPVLTGRPVDEDEDSSGIEDLAIAVGVLR